MIERVLILCMLVLVISACAAKPVAPFTRTIHPLVLDTDSAGGLRDQRGRFREIACAVMNKIAAESPGELTCDEALTRVGEEGGASGEPVKLGHANRSLNLWMVPGIGWECIESWLEYENEFDSHVQNFGHSAKILKVTGLSGTQVNAKIIRQAILEAADNLAPRSLVLLGYSKGAPDILQAIVDYPEIRPYILAVVSAAGAIGGSPLANEAKESQLSLLQHIPDASCADGDGRAIESLRPDVRDAWMAQHDLPEDIPYYSVVTFPQPERISSILKPSHNWLSRTDPRNDGQLIFYDQVIPGSTLIAFLNADHWAVAVPVAEAHPFIGQLFVDQNNFPRQALSEALLRFLDEDLAISD